MGKYDSIRAEFVPGTMTLRALAEKHGESYGALRCVAARQCWSRLRHEHACDVARRAKDEALAKARAWCADDVAAAEKLREVALKRLENADEMPLQELREAGKTLETAQKIGRTALGIEGGAPLPMAPEWNAAREESLQNDIGAIGALDEVYRTMQQAGIFTAFHDSDKEKQAKRYHEFVKKVCESLSVETQAELARGGAAAELRGRMYDMLYSELFRILESEEKEEWAGQKEWRFNNVQEVLADLDEAHKVQTLAEFAAGLEEDEDEGDETPQNATDAAPNAQEGQEAG